MADVAPSCKEDEGDEGDEGDGTTYGGPSAGVLIMLWGLIFLGKNQ